MLAANVNTVSNDNTGKIIEAQINLKPFFSSAHQVQEGEEEESGVVPKDCHAHLFSAEAVCSDNVGSGGGHCCR